MSEGAAPRTFLQEGPSSGSSVADRIAPQVMIHLEQLEAHMKSLDEELDRLEMRLSPVLVPTSPHALYTDERGDTAPQSRVADQVESAWRQLNELRQRLRTITERVEV